MILLHCCAVLAHRCRRVRALSLTAFAIAVLLLTRPISAQNPKPAGKYTGSAAALATTRILPAESASQLTPSERYSLGESPAVHLDPLSAAERQPHENHGLRSIGLERNISLQSSGRWETVSENQQVWRLQIVSPGAEAVQLHLRHFNHDAGRVFVSGSGSGAIELKGQVTGADDTLWSPSLSGEALTLEYEPLPGDNSHKLPFDIAGIVHIYGPMTPTANGCYMDEVCSPNPRANSVAVLTFTNPDDHQVYICTGTLVNISDATPAFQALPLLLTAGHCINSAAEAASTTATFNFKATKCGVSTIAQPSSVDPPATLLASTSMDRGDHALLRLSNFPVNYFTPSLSAWSTGDLPQTDLFTLHHVSGLPMKESFGYRLPDADTTVDGVLAPAEDYFRVGLSQGDAGAGASGAGIFDNTGTLMGTLTYGPTDQACQTYVGFGRLSSGFDALAPWLSGPQGGVAVATLVSPASGTALDSTSENFTWTQVPNATEYNILIGTAGPGSSDVGFWGEYTGDPNTITATMFSRLPVNVSNVWVRLKTGLRIGNWYNDYTFQTWSPPDSSITSFAPITWTPMRALSYTVTIGDTGPGSSDIFRGSSRTTREHKHTSTKCKTFRATEENCISGCHGRHYRERDTRTTPTQSPFFKSRSR